MTGLYSGTQPISQPITTTIGNTVVVQNPPYTISYGEYTGTAVLTGPSTISTVLPSGNVQGTYIIVLPVRYVTITTYYMGTAPITEPITSTVGPSGTRSGYVIVQTPPAYTTTTQPYTGTQSSITVPITQTYQASGSDAWTVIIQTPPSYTPPVYSLPPYETTTQLYTGASSITGPITYTTIPPQSTRPGTVVIQTPPAYSPPVYSEPAYVTTTQLYTGASSITAPITYTTIPPSGTKPGTVVIQTPPSYSAPPVASGPPSYETTTQLYTGASSITGPITFTTISPSGTRPGTVVIQTPPSYSPPVYSEPGFITTTQLYTGASSISGPITYTTIPPSGTRPGTVIIQTPPAYSPPPQSSMPSPSISATGSNTPGPVPSSYNPGSFPSVGLPSPPIPGVSTGLSIPPSSALSTFVPQSSSGQPASSGGQPPGYSSELFTSSSPSSTLEAPPTYATLAACPPVTCNSSANNATLCDSSYGNAFNVTCGTVYIGTVRKRATVESANECLTECDAEPQCVAVNYRADSTDPRGNCEILTSVERTEQEPGVAGAERPADAEPPNTVPPVFSTTQTAITSSDGPASSAVFSTTAGPPGVSTTSLFVPGVSATPSTPGQPTSSPVLSSSFGTPGESSSMALSSDAATSIPEVPSSSSGVPEISIPPIFSSTMMSSQTEAATSTSSSSIPAAPSAVCPAGNGTIVTSPSDVDYLLYCGSDTTGVLLSQTETANSYTACFEGCDALTSGCQGFTWVGRGSSLNGAGAGDW